MTIRLTSRPTTRLTGLVLAVLLALGSLVVLDAGATPPAYAAGSVSVVNSSGTAAIDPTYQTDLRVSGRGFQSIKGGHGGIYVFFGTVSGRWRPSQGGRSGADYVYVPDSESRSNQGYQKFVAFPGSDTASSANGGVISASGTWSTTIRVPGAVFQAEGRDGVRSVDCRTVTCGIITVGAHGVSNTANETFTPVRVADLTGGAEGETDAEPGSAPTQGSTPTPGEPGDTSGETAPGLPGDSSAPSALGKPTLAVDRASAVAGHTLSFQAAGLTPRSQISAVLDDGAAAAGPFLVGDDGRVTGVLTIPLETRGGTHELRLFGIAKPPTVRFAISAATSTAGTEPVSAIDSEASPSTGDDRDVAGLIFLAAAAVVLLAALLRLVLARRGRRRAA